jgi:enterochelin esterase family protein
MPNGHVDQTPPVIFDGPRPLRVELTDIPREFAADILPYVESHYRVSADRQNRAIAGLSMGGTQTLHIAMGTLDKFSAVGVFSSGILGASVSEWETSHLRALDDAKAKKGLKTVWFRTGSEDFLLNNTKSTVEMLRKHGFNVSFEETPGAHTWVNWRNYLRDFAPLLFR